jgi:hypothetical protein
MILPFHKMTKLHQKIIFELVTALANSPTDSIYRVMDRAKQLYRPNRQSYNQGDLLLALQHFNKIRKKDNERYLDEFRPDKKTERCS